MNLYAGVSSERASARVHGTEHLSIVLRGDDEEITHQIEYTHHGLKLFKDGILVYSDSVVT